MADLKISQLPLLTGAALQADDAFAVVDVSASETKKIETKDLIQSGIQFIDDLSIPGSKVDVTLQPGSVGTVELEDGSVTAEKMADQSTAILAAPLPVTGAYVGQLGVDSSTNAAYVWDGNTWVPFRTGIVDIQGGTVGAVTTNVTITGDSASVLAQIDDSTIPAAFLAGPTASGGEVSLRAIVPDDLPLATETTAGIVTVPQGGGLGLDGGVSGLEANLVIDNDITYSTSHHLVTYTEKGLVSGGRPIQGSDLPIATNSAIGAISAGQEFVVTPAGELQIRNVVTAAEYPVITYDRNGLVTSGRALVEDDIPGLNASKIISGQFGVNRIEDDAINADKLSDYATCLMQEDNPGAGDFLGQLWYTPSTAQLRVYARGSGPENIWLPVGFGLLQQQNLRFAFTFNAETSTITSITQYGAPLGLAVGDPIPTASDILAGAYGVCVTEGDGITLHDVNGENFTVGDWILCAGETTGWLKIDIADGAGGGGGAQRLDDLLDVTIGGPNPVDINLGPDIAPAVALQDGDILRYYSSIGQWVNAPERAGVEVSSSPPTVAPPGTMWWNPDNGRLFISYDDGDSIQWVPATPEAGGGAFGGNGGGTGGGGATTLNGLSDVSATETADAVLYWNESTSRWESTTTISSADFTIDGGSF